MVSPRVRRDQRRGGTSPGGVRTSLAWSLLNTVASRLSTLFTGILLARILVPADYGVFAIAVVVLGVLQSMNELGVSVAIVRWPGEPRTATRTAVTLSVCSSLTLYAIVFVAAPWITASFGAERATSVVRVLALAVLFDGIASIPGAMLTRSYRQDRRAYADLTALVVSSSLSIGLALHGAGVWSLVVGTLCGGATAAAMVIAMGPEHARPGWDRADARRLIAVGFPLAGSSLLLFAMLNVDYVIVGRMLGTLALGFYVLAFNLSSWPPNVLSFSVRRVSIAAFSGLVGDREALARTFTQSFRVLMTITLPLCLALVLLAGPLVETVYGGRWAPAVGPLRALAVLGGIRVALDLSYDLLVAAGRSRVILLLQCGWFLALIPAVTVGARVDGIRGVGLAHVVVASTIVLPAYLLVLAQQGVRPMRLAAALRRPALAGLAMTAIVLGTTHWIGSDWARLCIGGPAGVVAYACVAVDDDARRAVANWRARRRADDLGQPVAATMSTLPGGEALG